MDTELSRPQEIETDTTQFDDKISNLRHQFSQEIEDLNHLIKQKDVSPSSLFSNVESKVEEAVSNAIDSLKTIQNLTEDIEQQLGDIKDSPRKKLNSVNSILAKLQHVKELEGFYDSIFADNIDDPLELAMVVKQTEECLKSFKDKKDSEAMLKILPEMNQTFSVRKSEIIRSFNDKFVHAIQYPHIGGSSDLQLCISRKNISNFDKTLEAMELLGVLDEQLEHFSEEMLSTFVARILDSRSPPENLLRFDASPTQYSIQIKKNVSRADKIEPLKIFESLKLFFEYLHESLADFKIGKRSFMDMLGEKFSNKLIEMIIKDCLTASVPYEESQKAEYQTVIEAANKFHDMMKEYDFFQPSTLSFETFAEKFDQIFVNRRCAKIILAAKSHIFDNSVDTVEVGSSQEDSVNALQFLSDLSLADHLSLNDLPKDTHLPKLFQFHKCKISKSVFELGKLLENTMEAVGMEEQDFSAGKLLTTAQNMVKMYLLGAEKHRHETIASVPLFGALFYNDCYYLCHVIIMVSLKVQPKICKKWPVLASECNFISYLSDLRLQASDALEHHLLQARRQISSIVATDDIFLNLGSPNDLKECQRIINGCILQVQQISGVWADVLTDAVYVRALGSLVSYTLSIFTKMVLKKEDITEIDAKEIEHQFVILLKAFEGLMKIKGHQTIQAFCEADYHKTKEIIFCLKESLLNISDRWCEGKGPLAHWLKPDQVKQLIRALFQNTDRRAKVLEKIV